MQYDPAPWADPIQHLRRHRPDHAVLYYSPEVLVDTATRFLNGFPGLTTYAVKANDQAAVLANLVAAGITGFDVASPAEMAAVRAVCPNAALHYNNPVRSTAEVSAGIAAGVASWSVDDAGELEKLADVPRSSEVAVRFALPVGGAAYHFGDKFGATPAQAVVLLREVAARGWAPSLCFHPGTQCQDPTAWRTYILQAAQISQAAGVPIRRLNVGGGFPAHRDGEAPDLAAIFDMIRETVQTAFGAEAPELICEPGRAMVAEAFTLATCVKAARGAGGTIFLNDGIYGGLADLRDMGTTERIRVVSPDGVPRTGAVRPRVVFGPTCDSLDRLPGTLEVPEDCQPGDYVLFDGMGAYSIAMSTAFNGYGLRDVVSVRRLTGHRPCQG